MKVKAEIVSPIPPYLMPPDVSKEPIVSDDEADEQFSDGLNALINASNWTIYAQQCFMRCSDYAQKGGSTAMAAAMAEAATVAALAVEAMATLTEKYMPEELKEMSPEEQAGLRETMLRKEMQG